MAHNRFSVYFYLAGDICSLVEIKRQDLADESEPGKLYHWLRYNAHNNTLERLEFRSMHADPPRQEREFAQGSLRFDEHWGTFIATGSNNTDALRVLPKEQVPESILVQIEHYLDHFTA